MTEERGSLINIDCFKKYPKRDANKFFSPGTKITKGGRSKYGGHRVYDRGEHFEFNRDEFLTEVNNALSNEESNIVMMKIKDYTQDEMAEELGVERRTVPRKLALVREKLRSIKEKYFPHAKPLTNNDKRKMGQHNYYMKKSSKSVGKHTQKSLNPYLLRRDV